METNVSVSSSLKNNHLRIFIDDCLHTSVNADEIKAVVSYKSSGYFYIEYYLAENTIEITYKSETVWKKVLSELAKINVI